MPWGCPQAEQPQCTVTVQYQANLFQGGINANIGPFLGSVAIQNHDPQVRGDIGVSARLQALLPVCLC